MSSCVSRVEKDVVVDFCMRIQDVFCVTFVTHLKTKNGSIVKG